MSRLRVGLLVNPVAGLGGAVALKGSDGRDTQTRAEARGARAKAAARAVEFLTSCLDGDAGLARQVSWLSVADPMGAQCFANDGVWHVRQIEYTPHVPTTPTDTVSAARLLQASGIDLLVFVGGDGTARDILAAVGQTVPVLGVPAGVKMHSGVFAVTPRTAAALLTELVQGGMVAPVLREVRDYDDRAAEAEIRIRSWGELCVPEPGGYLQQTKIGGKESEPLAVQEIVAHVVEMLPAQRNLVFAPGSTCLAVKHALGFSGTLRGVDVRTASGEVREDVTAAELEGLESPYLIISFSRGQGFLFGRGNQQLSATFLKGLAWPDDVVVIGTRTKLASLHQQPLLLDTGDAELDDRFSGLVEIVTGYEDKLLYRLATRP